MSVKLTGTLEDVIGNLGDVRNLAVHEMFSQAIDFLVLNSPVDTGAYIESHSLSNTAGRPRQKQAKGRPREQPAPMKQAIARENLESDLAKLDLTKDVFNLRNNSLHAHIVENDPGGRIAAKSGKSEVYAKLANVMQGTTLTVRGSNG
tara:strand:+ start:13870 stop:14313 length:444 start_codon:yes stop_codon:yes gene_type:complete